VLSLDLIDITGELQRDITHNIVKTRLTAEGTVVPGSQVAELRNDIDKLNEQRAAGYCGSCYGADPPEGGCCNSCEAVREAYLRQGWSFGNPNEINQVWTLSCLSSHPVQTLERT
jgi:endoplasmic reticulum-Golgi intermediate compartment protein 3